MNNSRLEAAMIARRSLRSRQLARLAGAVAALGGFIALIGWIYDLSLVKTALADGANMKVNASIAFMAGGGFLWLGNGRARFKPLARILALVVACIGLITLIEYVFRWDPGIDQLLFKDTGTLRYTPGRMAPMTAFSFLLFGGAALMANDNRGSRLAEKLAMFVTLAGMMAIIGYAYDAQALNGVAPSGILAIHVAPHTAVLLLVLGAGALAAHPDVGWMALLLSDGLGGSTMRQLLPAAVVVPFVLGWLGLQGQRAGLWGTEFGVAILVVITILVLGAVILNTAASLERMDALEWRTQEASRLKSEFLANMSHELRTPLNAIIGFAGLMRSGKTGKMSPDQQEYLSDILTSSNHLLQLINDVLDLAKIESGTMEIRPVPVDTVKLVGEVRDVVRGLAASKRLRLDVTVDPEVSIVVVDPARVKQILFNYLSNAIKFTPEGGRVQIRMSPEGLHLFRVEVEDTGVGIAEEDLERLFVAFQQLDTGAAKQYQGTGLGLAVTKRVAEAHGGHVAVRSTVGKGSTFSVVLRRHTTLANDAATRDYVTHS